MADGKIIITGDAMQLIRENEKQVKSLDKIEKKYEALKNRSKSSSKAAIKASRDTEAASVRANKKARDGFQSGTAAASNYTRTIKNVGSGLMSMLGIAGTASAAIAALNSELEKRNRLESEAKDAGQSAEAGLQRARANFVADDTVGRDDFDTKVQASAQSVQVPVEQFATALADTLSAKGDLTNQQAFDITQAAFQAAPNKDAGAARELAQSAGDFSKLGGSQSPEAIIGFLAQSQQAARITDISKLGQNAFPAVQAGTQSGDTIEQAQELFLTLNNLIGDAEGRISSTASISLIEQLNAFEGTKDIQGGATDKLTALQQNPELAQAFLDASSFEKKSLPGIRSIVTGDERGLSAQSTVQEKVGSLDAGQDAQNIQAFNEYSSFLRGEGTTTGQIRQAEAQASSNIEGGQLANTERQLTASIKKIYAETLEKVNLPGLDVTKTFVEQRRLDFSSTPEQALGVAENLSALVTPGQSYFGGQVQGTDAQLVKQQIEVLKGLETQLQKLRSEQAIQVAQQVAQSGDANRLLQTIKSRNPLDSLDGR